MRPPTNQRAVVALAAFVLLVSACDTGDGTTLSPPDGTVPPPTTVALPIGSDGVADPASSEPGGGLPAASPFRVFASFTDGTPIDVAHTCDGDDVSPALSWTEPPLGTQEIAISMVDESTSGTPFVHWVVAGIDPSTTALTEGSVPLGAIQALNFFGDVGWGGPCPPPGESAHVYRFRVHALNQQVELADGTPATDFLDVIETVTAASADVTGTFQR